MLKDIEYMWIGIVYRLVQELDAYGVKVDIVRPGIEAFESWNQDGAIAVFFRETNTEPPEIKLDFTKHDSKFMPRTPKLFE